MIMKNNRTWIIITVILVTAFICMLCLTAGVLLYLVASQNSSAQQGTGPTTTSTQTTAPASGEWTVVPTLMSKTTDTATVNLTYPQLQNFPDATVMAGFNSSVLSDMQKISDEVTTIPGTGMMMANSADLDFTVAYKSDKFLSIAGQGSEYTGGAHPNVIIYTLNYDLSQGKKVAVGDLFKDDSYLKTISDYCIAQLNSRGLTDQDTVSMGAGQQAINFQDFDILSSGDKGLEIIFPPYQVAPYAAGTQTVDIPVSVFSAQLKPEYTALFGF